jgi:chromate transporter
MEAGKPQQIATWRLFSIWAGIGAQSFGGGSATLYLIRRVAVERYGWITEDEFTHFWGICQVVPGINILALVILIGSHVAGARGVAASLGGLLAPSAAITTVITAVYASIRDVSLVRAVIAGIVPATVGLGLLLTFKMVRPLLNGARRDGRSNMVFAALLFLACTGVAAIGRTPVLVVLWGAGLLSAITQWRLGRSERPIQ